MFSRTVLPTVVQTIVALSALCVANAFPNQSSGYQLNHSDLGFIVRDNLNVILYAGPSPNGKLFSNRFKLAAKKLEAETMPIMFGIVDTEVNVNFPTSFEFVGDALIFFRNGARLSVIKDPSWRKVRDITHLARSMDPKRPPDFQEGTYQLNALNVHRFIETTPASVIFFAKATCVWCQKVWPAFDEAVAAVERNKHKSQSRVHFAILESKDLGSNCHFYIHGFPTFMATRNGDATTNLALNHMQPDMKTAEHIQGLAEAFGDRRLSGYVKRLRYRSFSLDDLVCPMSWVLLIVLASVLAICFYFGRCRRSPGRVTPPMVELSAKQPIL